MRLRPYQGKAVNDVRRELGRCRSTILCMHTGLGKTVVAGHICQELAKHGHGAIILVHRRELVRQACRTLDKHGLEDRYGVVQAGFAESPWARFQVASIPTAAKRDLSYLKPRVVFVDEAHHVRAKSWENVVKQFSGAFLVGMSATPQRLDGKPLGTLFNSIVYGPSYQDSIKAGHLAETWTVYDKNPMSLKGVRKSSSSGDYNRADLSSRVNRRVVAHAVKAYMKHTRSLKERSCIFFGINRTHSRNVAGQFRDVGISAEHVDGSMSHADRDGKLEAFEDGRIEVLCNVGIVGEGFDVARCNILLDGHPTQSIACFKQMTGRAMRPNPDGSPSLHIDLVENVWRFGRPQDEWKWDLHGSAEMPGTERPRSANRVCKQCSTVFPSGREKCPVCSAPVPPPPAPLERERDLTMARSGRSKRGARKAAMRRMAAMPPGPERTRLLREIARDSGFGRRWIDNMETFLP